MTEQQLAEAHVLHDMGYSNMEISRCLTGVGTRAIDELFGPMPHPPARFSSALQTWWDQQPWVWRPDNQTPTEAPWERVSREWF